MSVNWVMLTADGKDIVPLENETTFYRQDGVRFELDSSNGGYPGAGSSYNSKSGTLLLTNQRVVYLCEQPNRHFTSASLPISNIQDSKLVQPWFSPSVFKSIVMPVAGGGLSQPARLAITFTSGSIHEFDSQYRSLRERRQELDGAAPQHLEQLPVYNPPAAPIPTSSVSTDVTHEPTPTTSSSAPRPSEPRPSPAQPTTQPTEVTPATAPAPPQPLPQAAPSDLPPSYDEIH
ncbi:hypothetical protein EMPS_03560 [Entomortierella parvispora]|uniref:GRAM domain-containing protein n=1 Tax=Entomortierella parvispora TaxID=205924 RepID=A0A9P3H725_9FUNG|nr:hypothetical protein EMPS_03560 [Entomortierella parvispora]